MSASTPDETTAALPLSADSDPVRVLLVDDQLMVSEAVRRALLNQENLTFHYCSNSAEALARAKEIRPTVILQDLVMPGLSGLELVRHYRADPVTQAIPIIVLSTKEEPLVKSDAFKSGANDYLVKLPDQIELIARVRHHSRAYSNHLQRDEAYRALHKSQQQLMEVNRELERLTNVDGLTGLSNRRYFNEYMEAEWKRAVRTQDPLSVLMIDIDHFKQYNDTYGHLGGDEALKSVGQAIKGSCKRSTDLAARFGGEEFVVVLPMTPLVDVKGFAEKLCLSVEALHIAHSASSTGRYLTISVGGATAVPQRGELPLTMVDTADKALYEAKRSGRNRAIVRGVLDPEQQAEAI